MKYKPMATPNRTRNQRLVAFKDRYVMPVVQVFTVVGLVILVGGADSIVDNFLKLFGL